MRIPRLFVDDALKVGQELVLSKETSHYIMHVLRLRIGTQLIIFNGEAGEYLAHLTAWTKKNAQINIEAYRPVERESHLKITLAQSVSRPERMDYAIQKSVELGVQRIVPVLSERSPPIDEERLQKREEHWQRIMISACEQCGRNHLPELQPTLSMADWLQQPQISNCIVLSPTGTHRLKDSIETSKPITILVGAEGGLTDKEINAAIQVGYRDISLGPRILRTETAAVAILTLCQGLWGDL